MDAVAAVSRVVLAAVFAVSAVAKLAGGRERLAASLADFGVPVRVARGVGWWVLPALELALAAALLLARGSAWPAWVALAVLAGFTALVLAALGRDVRPACPCFGAGPGAPVSGRTVLRNGVLLACAVLATA